MLYTFYVELTQATVRRDSEIVLQWGCDVESGNKLLCHRLSAAQCVSPDMFIKSWVRAGSSVGQSDGLTSRRSQVQALSRLPNKNRTPLYRTRGVAWFNTSACHAEDRGFKSRRVRQFASHLNRRLFGCQTICGFLLSMPGLSQFGL